MEPMGWIAWAVVGIVAGWLAGMVMKGGGYGLIGDLIIGLIGSLLGGYLFNLLGAGIGGGMIGSSIVAFIGACVLIFIVRMVSRGRTGL